MATGESVDEIQVIDSFNKLKTFEYKDDESYRGKGYILDTLIFLRTFA